MPREPRGSPRRDDSRPRPGPSTAGADPRLGCPSDLAQPRLCGARPAFDDPRPRAGSEPSTSESWVAAASITRGGWRRPSAREFRGCAACPRGSTTGSRTRTHGSLPPGRRLEPGQRPRRGDAGKVRGTEGALPDRSDEGRRVPHRRRALDSDVAPRAAARASLYGVDFFGDTVRVPEFSAPALGTRPNVVAIDAVIPEHANGVPYKLGGFPGASRASSRTASCATSTTCSRSSGQESGRRHSCRPAR